MKFCSPGKSQKTFVFTPLQAGPLKRDSGTIDSNWLSIIGRDVMRDGQKVTIYDGGVTTLTGKRGTLTIRDRNEWVDVGYDDGVAIGTWKVVRGTGQYAGIAVLVALSALAALGLALIPDAWVGWLGLVPLANVTCMVSPCRGRTSGACGSAPVPGFSCASPAVRTASRTSRSWPCDPGCRWRLG